MKSRINRGGSSNGRPSLAVRAAKSADAAILLALKISIGTLLIFMVVCITLQIVFRYFFEQPLTWSEELARFAFTWVSFLGAALAFEKGRHFGFDVIEKKLRPSLKGIVTITVDALLIVFFTAVLAGSMKVMNVARMSRSPGLRLHMHYVYLAIPTSCFLFIFFTIKKAVFDLRRSMEERKAAME